MCGRFERSWGVTACPEETGEISAGVWALSTREAAPTCLVGSQVTSVDVPVMRFFILPLFLLSEGPGLKINSGARWDESLPLAGAAQEGWGVLPGQLAVLFEEVL